MRLSSTQRELLTLMAAGHRLMWFGDSGPEIDCREMWPQKVTVRALIRDGFLRWGEYQNQTHRECGICPVELTNKGREAAERPIAQPENRR